MRSIYGSASHIAIWGIAALATAGVIIRPFKIPEAVWAVTGAAILLIFGLLPWSDAVKGVLKGTDVYLFLTGMMLLAEVARQEGLFDWLAARAVAMAQGSATRLFTLIYVVGIIVTTVLSNDATAVVLTPAVAAATRAAKVSNPLPYLFICAFIANAASFVLPISNPANLVIYGHHIPPLMQWLPRFALPSLLSIVVTYLLLRWTQRAELVQPIESSVEVLKLSRGGIAAALGIVATAAALMTVSALDQSLGLPTCMAGVASVAGVCAIVRCAPWRFFKEASWSVIPLVAGLFVLVEALDRSGVIQALGEILRQKAADSATIAAAAAGALVAFASNLINNLPVGLIAGSAIQGSGRPVAGIPESVSSAVLIGVDLGPNLSVTGSLATILWLMALRRDGIPVNERNFLKLGCWVMPPALFAALAAARL